MKKKIFVVQKHDATTLHYDFRLEIEKGLLSWAVPKGPSTDPKDKRLAILTEIHDKKYADFEGVIPEGEYGAGTVMVWDNGYFENLKEQSLEKCFKNGEIEVFLYGEKLKGGYVLIRMKDSKNWLLIKRDDKFAKPGYDIEKSKYKSVLSGKTLKQIAKEGD